MDIDPTNSVLFKLCIEKEKEMRKIDFLETEEENKKDI